MSVSPARATAFDILLRVEQEDSYAPNSCIPPMCGNHNRRSCLATELVMGVLRWRSSLDAAIAKASSQRLENSIRRS